LPHLLADLVYPVIFEFRESRVQVGTIQADYYKGKGQTSSISGAMCKHGKLLSQMCAEWIHEINYGRFPPRIEAKLSQVSPQLKKMSLFFISE
jgi:hypothetical protein